VFSGEVNIANRKGDVNNSREFISEKHFQSPFDFIDTQVLQLKTFKDIYFTEEGTTFDQGRHQKIGEVMFSLLFLLFAGDSFALETASPINMH